MAAEGEPITYGELFAGVGGFSIGFDRAGWECRFQVEWDAHCQQTLGYHWPGVPRWGDVAEVNGADLPPVDVISFGSPCQDLSVAGKREGLDGDRSNLFFEATRIINEMKEATGGQYPTWAVWENVAGAFSSRHGDDFARVLTEMGNIGGHHIEWHCLDAQFFGVPQRRRRVFVVACLNPAILRRGGQAIFPVGEGRRRNPTKSKQTRETTTGEVASSLRSGGSGNYPSERGDGSDNLVVEPQGFRMQAFGQYDDDDTASALKQRDYKDATDLVVAGPIGFSHTQGLDAQPSTVAFPTLRTEGNGHAVATNLVVRRLTPIECERLMGWPDNHTLHRADGKTNSDTTRYKMCGNGVASPVAHWVAEHLTVAHNELP